MSTPPTVEPVWLEPPYDGLFPGTFCALPDGTRVIFLGRSPAGNARIRRQRLARDKAKSRTAAGARLGWTSIHGYRGRLRALRSDEPGHPFHGIAALENTPDTPGEAAT